MTKKSEKSSSTIRDENLKPGTSSWMLDSSKLYQKQTFRCAWREAEGHISDTPYVCSALEGYASASSVKAGEKISFFVSTSPAVSFEINIFRMGYYGGLGGRHMLNLGSFQGQNQPMPKQGNCRLHECQWESCASVKIPPDWVSGVYLAKLSSTSGIESYIVFIVRDERQADFVFQCADFTWQAYNRWPSNFSLYDDGTEPWYWGPNVDVSLDRPYGKQGSNVVDNPLTLGSGEWFLWEYPICFWLESLGYDVTYISCLDTHERPETLRRAKGFLSVGHDEYYTIEMFNHLKQAVADGLNIAFLSGNTCCGLLELKPAKDGRPNRILTRVDRFGPVDPGNDFLFVGSDKLPRNAPDESFLIGARSKGLIVGGADWICTNPNHWIYEKTGMLIGDRIPGLIGWEWHGDPAPIKGLEILATGVTTCPRGEDTYTATIYPGPHGNFVFNASTCWWCDGLSAPPGYMKPSVYATPQGPDKRVQQMTINLLERIKRSTWKN